MQMRIFKTFFQACHRWQLQEQHLSTVNMAMSVAAQLIAPMITADSSEDDFPEPSELKI